MLSSGRWRVNEYGVYCGTLRIASFDFDTDPSVEFRSDVYEYMEQALNKAAEAEERGES
jgi:hypothetical protein